MRVTANGYRIAFGDDENVKLIVVMDALLDEYTKITKLYTWNEWIVGYVNHISVKLFQTMIEVEFITPVLWGITNDLVSGDKENIV